MVVAGEIQEQGDDVHEPSIPSPTPPTLPPQQSQDLPSTSQVVISEATIRDDLHLDDAEGVDCLPNEEIFAELAPQPWLLLSFACLQ
nr:hypothetical protein [Tanacetum cinerariifolium]